MRGNERLETVRTLTVLIAICVVLVTLPAPAQQVENDAAKHLVTRYYECVRASAADQIKIIRDRRMAVEQSFLACATEERTIRVYMSLENISPATAESIILKHKTALKNEFEQARRVSDKETRVLKRTQVAEALLNSLFSDDTQSTATAAFNYCTETSKQIPRNTQAEDEELERVTTSSDWKRMESDAKTVQYSRWQLQKRLKECVLISQDIRVRKFSTATVEALLWIRLAGTFDLAGLRTHRELMSAFIVMMEMEIRSPIYTGSTFGPHFARQAELTPFCYCNRVKMMGAASDPTRARSFRC